MLRRPRSFLLATLVVAALGAPAPASAAIEILGRGIAPDPAVENGSATFTVDVQVGQAPYIIEFVCCDLFDTDTPEQYVVRDETSPETQRLTGRHTFTFNVGPRGMPDTKRFILIRVADSNGDLREERFRFQDPRPPTPPPPPTPPEPQGPTATGTCQTTVMFALIKARTIGGSCWTQMRVGSSPYEESGVKVVPRGTFWQTRDRFVLNGIPFPAAPDGTNYILAEPTSDAPGGQIGLNRTITVQAGPITVLKKPLLWKLPAENSDGKLAALTLPTGTLSGLPIGGEIQILFRKRAGKFTTSFPVQVTLPSIFRPSPGTVGSITGATEISTDDAGGVSIDGGRIEIANAAIGKLGVKSLCFSYLSANVSSVFAACKPPDLSGAPAVTCAPPTRSQERFDGAMLITIPTPSRPDLAAYGGIANREFAYGGGFIDNAAIPIVQGITLERVGFGLCLKPSLLIKGDAGLGFANGLVRGNVSLTYAEPTSTSFFVEAAGDVNVAEIPIGNGRVRVNSNGTVDFDLMASVFLAGGFVQLDGGVSGFFQPRPTVRFNVDGRIAVCLNLRPFGTPCVVGTAVVSNLGAGGCGDFFFGKYSGFFFWKKPAGKPQFEAGSGCGFQERVRVFRGSARAAQAGVDFEIPADNDQYVAHFTGTNAPPKVKITSPSGRVIESGPGATTTDGESFLILENPTAPETSIFLGKSAAAGNWKVEAMPGSAVTGVETQAEEKKGTVLAGKITTKGERRVLDLRYFARDGDRVALDLVGKNFNQPLAAKLTGKRCTGDDKAPGRTTAESLCTRIEFTPTFGFAGPRTVKATVTDADGAAIDTIDVASYRAPSPPRPKKVPDLRLVRKGTTVFAVWGSAGGNTERYASYVRLSDGRRFGHTAPKACFAWRIDDVRRETSVQLRIQAGRQDVQFGGPVVRTLRSRQLYSGPAKLKRARIPRACPSL